MTDAHLGAVRTAIAHATDAEHAKYLEEVAVFVEKCITPAPKIAPGKYSLDEFRRVAAEKLNKANREE